MNSKAKRILIYVALVIIILFFMFWGLSMAKGFLAPVAVAGLLAMIIVPVANWFEKKGISRGWSALFSDVLILIFCALVVWVISAQVKSITEDWPQIKERVEPKVAKLQQFIADKTGISVTEQDQKVQQNVPGDFMESGNQEESSSSQSNSRKQQSAQQSSSPATSSVNSGDSNSSSKSFVMGFLGFMGTFLLTFVYIFFFLLYRDKFRKSVVNLAPAGKQETTENILDKSASISQNYLFGKLILIILLSVIYSAGLSISGVRNAILISILAAVLTLIPYIGNIIGYGLALGMAFFSGAGLMGAVGVTVTFAITQFIESYVLEPYIVGDKVNLNPVFTIIAVVLGEAVWGVVGMLIAIPALGIVKVVFDNIPVLNPLGYFLGEEDMGNDRSSNIFTKLKDKFKS